MRLSCSEDSDLLEAAGVDTVPERKKGSAAAHNGSLIETNQAERLVTSCLQLLSGRLGLPRIIENESVSSQS
jgi:hypothetical protein